MAYLKTLSLNQKIILLMFASLCLPYYLLVPIQVGILLYVLFTKQYSKLLHSYNLFFYIFLVIIIATSCYYRNLYGLIGCFAFFLIFSLAFFYQQNIDRKLFEVGICILIGVSFIWGIVSIFQYAEILSNHDISGFVFQVFAKPEDRVFGSVYNANYYASCLEIIMLMIAYKFVTTKSIKMKCFYMFSFLWNLVFLILCACRSAWISLPIALIVFFFLNKNHRENIYLCLTCLCVGIYFLFNPEQIPRINNLESNYGVRELIWVTAMKGIMDHPFFGQGPFTYMRIYEIYGGHATEHAHSLYLEPLLSYGIIGCIPLLTYFIFLFRKVMLFYQTHRTVIALVLAGAITTIIHGVTDYSVFFLHSGLILLMLILSYPILEGE